MSVVFDGNETTIACTEMNKRKKRNSPMTGDGGWNNVGVTLVCIREKKPGKIPKK
jgi:hypothetical protein